MLKQVNRQAQKNTLIYIYVKNWQLLKTLDHVWGNLAKNFGKLISVVIFVVMKHIAMTKP